MSCFRIALVFACLLGLACASNQGVAGKVTLAVNPIRRVVTMLQSMQKKVAQEGKKEEVLNKPFTCSRDTNQCVCRSLLAKRRTFEYMSSARNKTTIYFGRVGLAIRIGKD